MKINSRIADLTPLEDGRVRLRLKGGMDPNTLAAPLEETFRELFAHGVNTIVFDLFNFPYPNATFIASLIRWTLEARGKGGDLQLLNLADTARDHLTLFSPLTYLTIGRESITAPQISQRDFEAFLELETDGLLEGKPAFLHLEARVESLERVMQFAACCSQKAGMEKTEISKLKIAVYEACMNVIEHGYKFRPDVFMGVEISVKGDSLDIAILDHGESFDFYNRKSYDVHQAVDERRDGGFGLYIIERSVDEIHYETDPAKGNKLTLVKHLRQPYHK